MTSDDITTCIIDLPTTIKSYVVALIDGRYCIVLNARMDYQCLYEAYQHELAHIVNGDYTKFNVDSIERTAHSL